MEPIKASTPRTAGALVPSWMRGALAAGLIVNYAAAFTVLRPYLPEKWFIDSSRILDLVGGVAIDNSFAATAALFGMLPPSLLSAVVFGLGSLLICLTVFKIERPIGLAIAPLILFPLLMLGLLAPNKETIIIALSLGIAYAARYMGREAIVALVIMIYVPYAYYVREYYALILLVWLMLVYGSRLPRSLMLCLIPCLIAAFMLVPADILMQIQGPRDEAFIVSEYVLGSDNRTSFTNPFIPDDQIAFLGNYMFAFIFLHFPFIRFISFNEFILFLNVIAYARLLYIGLKSTDHSANILAKLFAAHITVLWLFEPDLGSYFRHFSSVFAYLLPSFALLAAGRAYALPTRA